MAKYEKRILSGLLDSYENSLLSRGENKIARRVAYSFDKKHIPEYFDESSMAYEEIHACAMRLCDRGFVTIEWKNKKAGHIIEKVFLNESAVMEVYSYLNRVPKEEKEAVMLGLLEELAADASPVAVNFITWLIERIREGKSVKEFVELSALGETRRLVKAVSAVERNQESCYIREFSVRNFGDSKLFESMISKLGKVWRRFGPNQGDKDTDIHEVLAEHYIYSTPNYIYFKGTALVYRGSQEVDLEVFSQGIGLSGEDLEHIRFFCKDNTKKVITIENLTTFFRWTEKESLIIYLGGYHNSLRCRLLNMIYEQLPDAKYLHFGDIDVGGFEIYEDLCRKTGIPFSTYRMGIEELERYHEYTKALTVNDVKRLKRLMDSKADEKCSYREVLEFMYRNNVKLEQECIHSLCNDFDDKTEVLVYN